MLKDAIQKVNEETLAFQTHKNAGKVWAVAENKLSSVFNHLGRSLALLLSDQQVNKSSHQVDQFFARINLVSQKWGQIVRRLLDAFTMSGKQLGPNTLDQIGEIVDDGFRSVGLEPYK